jgi:prolyl oligopeptidase
MPPTGDGSRAGFYYVNTHDLKSRPLYELETLSYHEAVPGHHLQIALQQEMKNLPNFRRFTHFMGYMEGWALYSERLGKEAGFFENPYYDFGRLTYEIWRACRLVVDTGIHYFGWPREKAVDFMKQNTALSELNISSEVDRYIAWPGQALSYKMGELKLQSLRDKAQNTLKGAFDLREFHEVVLKSGAIPLSLLEKNIENFIKKTMTQNGK